MNKWHPLVASAALALVFASPSFALAKEGDVTVGIDKKQTLADRLAVILNSEKAMIGDSGDDAKARQFALDLFGASATFVLAMTAYRFWPIVAAVLHALPLLAHVSRAVDVSMNPWSISRCRSHHHGFFLLCSSRQLGCIGSG